MTNTSAYADLTDVVARSRIDANAKRAIAEKSISDYAKTECDGETLRRNIGWAITAEQRAAEGDAALAAIGGAVKRDREVENEFVDQEYVGVGAAAAGYVCEVRAESAPWWYPAWCQLKYGD